MSSNELSQTDPTPLPPVDLLIAAATARPMAQSATRAGYNVATALLYPDRDVPNPSAMTHLPHWPEGLLAWTRRFPPEIPFVYGGALENQSEQLEIIATERPCAGLHGPLLTSLRDPHILAGWAPRVGVKFPNFITDPRQPTKIPILIKSRRSGAGAGVTLFDGAQLQPGQYAQQQIPGLSVSAAWLISETAVELIGTSLQWPTRNHPDQERRPFLYGGSLAPCPHDLPVSLTTIGASLAEWGVRGLCGIDFIASPDGDLYLLEINPRFTASMELWEQFTTRSLVAEHLNCFQPTPPTHHIPPATPIPPNQFRAKWVVYANRPVRWTDHPQQSLDLNSPAQLRVADIPPRGTFFEPGQPICMIYATANSEQSCIDKLDRQERQLLDWLDKSTCL